MSVNNTLYLYSMKPSFSLLILLYNSLDMKNSTSEGSYLHFTDEEKALEIKLPSQNDSGTD